MKKKNWNDITLKQFYQIQNLISEPDEYTELNLLDCIYDIDSATMKLSEFAEYAGAIDFISKEVPTVDLKKQYTINGSVYNSNFDLTVVTAAQFIDYQNYVGTNKWEDFLSVFFIPEGHTYNDGYDMKKTKDDMLCLDFPTVKSITFFFTIQFATFLVHFLQSFKKRMKKMKMSQEQKQKIEEYLKKLEQHSLALSQLY